MAGDDGAAGWAGMADSCGLMAWRHASVWLRDHNRCHDAHAAARAALQPPVPGAVTLQGPTAAARAPERRGGAGRLGRSEEHTSELQSPCNLVCRLLLEKKKRCRSIGRTLHSILPRRYLLRQQLLAVALYLPDHGFLCLHGLLATTCISPGASPATYPRA